KRGRKRRRRETRMGRWWGGQGRSRWWLVMWGVGMLRGEGKRGGELELGMEVGMVGVLVLVGVGSVVVGVELGWGGDWEGEMEGGEGEEDEVLGGVGGVEVGGGEGVGVEVGREEDGEVGD
ncbi:hypothetical protein, partial [Dermacoccus nishinomiyaensis]|uniref:hypothetical protein n=1 Tax=Dermacoccus nishinomiyaensis TaxID=1274 RepID=UPI001642F38D